MPAPLTVTASNASKVYGQADPAFAVGYSGLVNGDTSAVVSGLSISTSAMAGSNVGTYSIVPGGAAASNYAISYADGYLSINPAPLAVTADDQSKTYGAALPALTYMDSGLVNGDTGSVLSGSLAALATASSNVGSYAINQGTLSAGATIRSDSRAAH